MRPRGISVIVTTYEWSKALDVVLRSLSEQATPAVEVVVADDGSGPDTAAVVERWQKAGGLAVEHVWQRNEGWRNTRAKNLGALRASGDYLLFLDGDSVPRRGMLAATRKGAIPGWFLASKRLHLGRRLTERTLAGEVHPWRWPTLAWLRAPGEFLRSSRETRRIGVLVPVRDRSRPWHTRPRDFRPPFGAFGFYFGVWRSDFERVNGFDMRFTGWGGEDEDIAARLGRAGVRCGWPGAGATMLHLWHEAKGGTMRSNHPPLEESLAGDHVEAPEGLRELAAELRAGQSSA